MNSISPVRIIGSFIIAITLLGCEGNTTHQIQFGNASSSTLKVKSSFQEAGDTLMVNENEVITLSVTDQRGGNSEPTLPSTLISELFVTNSAGDSLTKNFRIDTNWTIETIHHSKVPSDYTHYYSFTVKDEDLE